MKHFLLLIAVAFSTCQIFAVEKDPIDLAMAAAIEKNPSTAGMTDAIDHALTQWDKKLNASYKGLQAKLPADEWKELVIAQRSWLAFRDAQIKAMDLTFARLEGTMWIPIRAEMIMNITRQRAQFLESMLDHVSMQ